MLASNPSSAQFIEALESSLDLGAPLPDPRELRRLLVEAAHASRSSDAPSSMGEDEAGPSNAAPPVPSTSSSDQATSTLFTATSHIEAACNTLHKALRTHKKLVDPPTPNSRRGGDRAFLEQVIAYSRKIGFNQHPGWFVPGQFFGDKRSWAPFAGEMATSRLLATAKQEAAQRAAAKDERKKQLRAKLQSLQSLQSGTMAHEGEVKGAAAVPGGLMVNGVFIPRMPEGWKPGDPLPSFNAPPAPTPAPAAPALAARPIPTRTTTTDASENVTETTGGDLTLGDPDRGARERTAGTGTTTAAPAAPNAIDMILNPDLEVLEYCSEDEEDDDF